MSFSNKRIRKKIRTCKESDHKASRYYRETDYVTTEWVRSVLLKQKYICLCCSRLLSNETLSDNQFSIDRLDDRLAHTKTNCQILCLKCNKGK